MIDTQYMQKLLSEPQYDAYPKIESVSFIQLVKARGIELEVLTAQKKY